MLCELWLSQRYLKTGKKEKIISITALISTLGITLGVLVLIVVIAVMSGFDAYLQDKIVGTNSHLLLEFYGANAQIPQISDRLKVMPQVVASAPYVSGQAFMKIDAQIISLELRGIDPVLQVQVTKIGEYLRQGSLQLQGNEVVLGEELALRLGLRLGEKIALVSPETLAKTEFRIKGLFNTGMYLYDSGLVITSLKAAQDFFQFGDALSGIGIKIDDIYRAEAIKQQIYKSLQDIGRYEIRTWVDSNRNFLNALKLEKIVMFIVVTMTTVVAAFGIASTLIMSVMSRIKDVGILRSIGAKTKSILQIFIFQGLSMGATGIILGLVAGVSLTLSLNKVIDFISQIIGRSLIPKDIYYFDRIPTAINVTDVTLIVVCTLAITLLASVYPAYYAARINPSEALRHE